MNRELNLSHCWASAVESSYSINQIHFYKSSLQIPCRHLAPPVAIKSASGGMPRVVPDSL